MDKRPGHSSSGAPGTAAASSGAAGLRQYYVAVGSTQVKMVRVLSIEAVQSGELQPEHRC